MSRGDQRERDRAKNLAKQQAKAKQQSKGGDPLSRNANDAAALQAKVAAKAEKKQADEATLASNSKTPVVRKKGVAGKKNESVDDLLAAGLAGNKKRAK